MGIVFKKNYSASTAYSIDNIVRYTDGKTYISLANSNTGHTPGASGSENYWKELAGVKYNSDNPDWNENDPTKSSYIQNRPIIYKEFNNLTFADFGNNHDDFNEFTIDGTTYYPAGGDGHWLPYYEEGRINYSVNVKDENDNEYWINVDVVESSGEFIAGSIYDGENYLNITSNTSYGYTCYQVNPAYKDFFDSLGGSGAGIDVDYETTDTQVVVTMTSGSNTATISFDLADIKEY